MKRNALFVGVDKYADGHIPDLSCAVRDATDLHGFFKYGAGYDRVELLPNPAGKKEVLSAVRELTAGLGRGDFFLFFFAGHGFRVGENHVLVCSKDLYDDVKYEEDGLPLGQRPRFSNTGAGSFVLLDGAAPAVPPLLPSPPGALPALVVCPVCLANVRIEGTRNCAKCGRKYVCADCWDRERRCCSECAGKARREEAERKAREAASWNEKGDDCYYGRNGVAQSDTDAVAWYRKAADQGNAPAQSNLGVMYENGRGVAQSDAEAVKWYRKAADQGNARAQYNLGWRYENGRGVAQSDAEAVAWYRKAAEQGHENAKAALRRRGIPTA